MAGNRIIIDGVSYGSDELDIIPEDLKRVLPQIRTIKNGVVFRGKEAYLSNFFPTQLIVDDKTYSSVEQFYQFSKCEVCKDYDRAEKILSTDDPVHIKAIGDGCKTNEEWLEVRVFTLFKAIFYMFAQSETLALKLVSTGKAGLYEATTDLFYGAGASFYSKKWDLNTWSGRNVTGRLLMKVRRVLKKKMDEGIELNKLIFSYSLPSLQRERVVNN